MRPLRNPQPNLTTEAIMEQQNFPISSSPRPSERLRPAQDEVVGLDALALLLPAGLPPRPLHRATVQGLRLEVRVCHPAQLQRPRDQLRRVREAMAAQRGSLWGVWRSV